MLSLLILPFNNTLLLPKPIQSSSSYVVKFACLFIQSCIHRRCNSPNLPNANYPHGTSALSTSPCRSPRRVWLVHRRNLSCNRRPFKFSLDWLPSSLLAKFVPFQQLVSETEMWLDDDIQPPCPYIAVCPWKRKAM